MLYKCICGYETERCDNFTRHRNRKKTWCKKDEMENRKKQFNNTEEQIILFYYKMINKKKDFALWIRNMKRVNTEFNSLVVDE